MSTDLARYQQQQQQLSAMNRPRPTAVAATYSSRDPETGERILTAGDGGTVRTAWITTAIPDGVPPLVQPSSTLGTPGYASQKPV
jgi:hypothetical protein